MSLIENITNSMFPFDFNQISMYDGIITFGASIILAILMCFLTLFVILQIKKSRFFEREWTDTSKLLEYGKPCFIFVFFAQFGVNIFIKLMNPDVSLEVFLFSPILVLGLLVVGRIFVLTEKNRKRHAKTLLYGITVWSILLFTISLYSRAEFIYYIIPGFVWSAVLTVISPGIDYSAKKIVEISKNRNYLTR